MVSPLGSLDYPMPVIPQRILREAGIHSLVRSAASADRHWERCYASCIHHPDKWIELHPTSWLSDFYAALLEDAVKAVSRCEPCRAVRTAELKENKKAYAASKFPEGAEL